MLIFGSLFAFSQAAGCDAEPGWVNIFEAVRSEALIEAGNLLAGSDDLYATELVFAQAMQRQG